jgi:hypothetical protein
MTTKTVVDYYVEHVRTSYWVMRKDKRFWKIGPFHDREDATVVLGLLKTGKLREGE